MFDFLIFMLIVFRMYPAVHRSSGNSRSSSNIDVRMRRWNLQRAESASGMDPNINELIAIQRRSDINSSYQYKQDLQLNQQTEREREQEQYELSQRIDERLEQQRLLREQNPEQYDRDRQPEAIMQKWIQSRREYIENLKTTNPIEYDAIMKNRIIFENANVE